MHNYSKTRFRLTSTKSRNLTCELECTEQENTALLSQTFFYCLCRNKVQRFCHSLAPLDDYKLKCRTLKLKTPFGKARFGSTLRACRSSSRTSEPPTVVQQASPPHVPQVLNPWWQRLKLSPWLGRRHLYNALSNLWRPCPRMGDLQYSHRMNNDRKKYLQSHINAISASPYQELQRNWKRGHGGTSLGRLLAWKGMWTLGLSGQKRKWGKNHGNQDSWRLKTIKVTLSQSVRRANETNSHKLCGIKSQSRLCWKKYTK